MVEAGVMWASLTDHNTMEGTYAFGAELQRHGRASVTGVEMDARSPAGPLHILGYGIDLDSEPLNHALAVLKHPMRFSTHRLSARICGRVGHRGRALPKSIISNTDNRPPYPPDTSEVISLIHGAKGFAFLAHPLESLGTIERVKTALDWLVPQGLDGLEVFHKPYSQTTIAELLKIAEERNILAVAGSDFHGTHHCDGSSPGVDMPLEHWEKFVSLLRGGTLDTSKRFLERVFGPRWSGFFVRIVLPAMLAIILFVLAIFLIIIPSAETQLLEGKKKTTQELTRAAVSILEEYYAQEQSGILTRTEAQAQAVSRIKMLRYGDDGKDYFWITDMHPTMIMHPYLPELNGQDLTNYEDLRGKRMFVAFVEAVRDAGAGFVDYYWQWKDNPDLVVPKVSYVEEFAPWGWVIGTGIYIQDVKASIASFERNLIYISLAIIIIVALLLFYGLRQSMNIERKRSLAEEALKESHERYRALVEATTEGLLMTFDGRASYSNKPMLDMLGYSAEELASIDIDQIFADDTSADKEVLSALHDLWDSEAPPQDMEVRLRTKSGERVDALISVTPIEIADRHGLIFIVRSMSGQKAMQAALDETRRQFRTMSNAISLGVFRSTWGRKAMLIEANPAMRNILALSPMVDISTVDWLERVIDPESRDAIVTHLNTQKAIQDYRVALRRENGGRVDVSLFAVLVDDGTEDGMYCDAILEDITKQRRSEEERESLIAQLQTSLFFMQESVSRSMVPALSLGMNESIAEAAALMNKNRVGVIFVTGPEQELMGVVTDHDFRERIVAGSVEYKAPLRSVMTAPVASIGEDSPLYEALLRMQDGEVDSLAVLDASGRLKGLVRLRDLLRYQRSSSVIISDSVRRARTVDDVVDAHKKLPALVKAVVDSGAATRHINRIISGVSDVVVQRLVSMAMDQLGPAPAPYAFLALGSEGREEQTLRTDQDNAIVYEDPAPEKAGEVSEYFLRLGTMVCDWLDHVGYSFCEGGVMAKNPRWNQPLSIWRSQFSHWIHNAGPQELLELNMLFDFRCVDGDPQIARALRANVLEEMQTYPLFFLHFAQNTLLYKPPLNMLGNFQTVSAADGSRALSLKEALMPVVNFARLYSLKYRVDSTNTLDRLAELKDLGVLSRESYEEMVPDYEALMRIRLARQADAIERGLEPTNLVAPGELTSSEAMKLKRLFATAVDLRKKISFDFLGGIAGF
jgi:PAS domain S-box-containing protein